MLPEVRAALGEPVLKADVYELEQAIGDEVQRDLLAAVVDGSLSVADLMSDTFLYELHRRLYGDIWQWAGRRSARERNIGVSPELIAVELRSSLDNIMYRWDHTNDWDARGLGLVAHAETVRIHPFVDGNGRSTRLLAELVFVAAQDGPDLWTYDWDVDKTAYIHALRQYDVAREVSHFVRLVPILPLD